MTPPEPDRPQDAAQELVEAVDDLVAHGHDDLAEGPSPPLGGEVRPNPLTLRRESEIAQLSEFGKAILNASGDERIKIRNRQRRD